MQEFYMAISLRHDCTANILFCKAHIPTNKSCECMSFVNDDCLFKQIINFCAFFIPIKKTQKINNRRKDLQYGISILNIWNIGVHDNSIPL